MKKIVFTLVMILTSLLVVLGSRVERVYATSSDRGLFVHVDKVNASIIEHACCSIDDYAYQGAFEDYTDGVISLGYPIRVTAQNTEEHSIYHFPVMHNGRIISIMALYDDGSTIHSQLESNRMSEVFELIRISAKSIDPTHIIMNDGGLYAYHNGQIEPLDRDVDSKLDPKSLQISSIKYPDNEKLKDICAPIKTINLNADEKQQYRNIPPSLLMVKSVPQTLDGTFTGQQMNWCGAAVTAAIINNKKWTSLTAKDITIAVHGKAINEGITNSQVINMGKKHGLYPVQGGPLSTAGVQKEINRYRPIYMYMERSTSTGKAYHALGLIGYTSTKYVIINPWYKDRLYIDKKNVGTDVMYISGSKVYRWNRSVHNWR